MSLPETNISKNRIEPKPKVLYVVGTPIGNLNDLSPRAQKILQKVSFIACEDTRHSGLLLKRIGATGRLISFHKHNTKKRIPQIIQLLGNESIALISDAGLPGISDPGQELVSVARQNGYEVICIPGPCAAITALVISGLPSDRFCFEGFLPSKSKDRKKALSQIAIESRTCIIYESPHRLLKLLKELNQFCGEGRKLQVARELTKKHEELIGSNIGEVFKHFTDNKPIGEFTLVLEGSAEEKVTQPNQAKVLESLRELRGEGISVNDSAKILSKETGYSKRYLYELASKIDRKVD